MIKITAIVSTILVASLMLASCGTKTETTKATSKPQATATAVAQTGKSVEELTEKKDYITIKVNVNGETKNMSGEIYPELAPETVKNFEKLVDEQFYTGLIFHRVIPGFMIQGGGYDKDMKQKDADPIKGEFNSNGFDNPLKHTEGVLSMARTQVPDSASSQFFIMHKDYPSLDGEYAAFGKITEGIEVIDEIANVSTTSLQNGMSDVPVDAVVIEEISYTKGE